MSILLLDGSPSPTARSVHLLELFGASVRAAGLTTESLHVIGLPPDALLHGHFHHPAIAAAIARVSLASAVIIATPVYQSAYSGVLKSFLDLLPHEALAKKIIVPLASGDSQAQMLAIDYALRPVLSALGARQVLTSVFATDAQIRSAGDIDVSLQVRIDKAVQHLIPAVRSRPAPPPRPVAFASVACSV